jgi:hypothetical protein
MILPRPKHFTTNRRALKKTFPSHGALQRNAKNARRVLDLFLNEKR